MPSTTSENSPIVVFDIDGVIRDVSGSYRRAIADTVEKFTAGAYRPSQEAIDQLKAEGCWNNDWEASQELVYRYFEAQDTSREQVSIDYEQLIDFFQQRYRGSGNDPDTWTGYICQEPLLASADYFASLTAAGIAWGFFSGATRSSAEYILCRRIGLQAPILVAMEDAPSKPDPVGLFNAVQQLEARHALPANCPVVYVGDTVADLYTVTKAMKREATAKCDESDAQSEAVANTEVETAAAAPPIRRWFGVGIVPPHAQTEPTRQENYRQRLREAGANLILHSVEALTPEQLQALLCVFSKS